MSARNSGVAGSIDELRLLVESAAARRPQLTSRLEKAALMMKPEWAVGWYRAFRQYYLASNHPPDDLQSWESCAEETARAIPVAVWPAWLLEESETLTFEH